MNLIKVFIVLIMATISICGCKHDNNHNALILPSVIEHQIEPIDYGRNYTDRYTSKSATIAKKAELIEDNNILQTNDESISTNEFEEQSNYQILEYKPNDLYLKYKDEQINNKQINDVIQNVDEIQEYKENNNNDNATIKITYFRVELNENQSNDYLDVEDNQEESSISLAFIDNEKPEDHQTLIDYIPEDEQINFSETIIYKEEDNLPKKNIDEKKIFYPKYVFGASKVIIKEFLTKTAFLNKAGISFFSRFFGKIAEKDVANEEIDINNIAISTLASDYETIKSFVPIQSFPGSTILVPAASTAIVINNDKALDVFKHLTAVEISQIILNYIQYIYLGKTIEQQECNTYKFIELIQIKALTEVAASYIEYYLVEDLETFVMMFFIIIQI